MKYVPVQFVSFQHVQKSKHNALPAKTVRKGDCIQQRNQNDHILPFHNHQQQFIQYYQNVPNVQNYQQYQQGMNGYNAFHGCQQQNQQMNSPYVPKSSRIMKSKFGNQMNQSTYHVPSSQFPQQYYQPQYQYPQYPQF